MHLVDPQRSPTSGLGRGARWALLCGASSALAAGALALPRPLAQDPVVPRVHGARPLVEAPSPRRANAPALESARAALEGARSYLIATQEESGRWTAGAEPLVLESGEFNAIGVTGLAVLALLEQPAREREARSELAIDKGLRWLASQQDAESGLFGNQDSFLFMPSHAVALRAFLRGNGERERVPEWRDTAERGLHFLHRSRNPYGAWRYSNPPIGDNDSVITSLYLLALAEAQDLGLEHVAGQGLHEPALRGGLSFLEEVYEPSTGRTGYLERGSLTSRLAGMQEDFPPDRSELASAISTWARLELGQDPFEEESLRKGAWLVAELPPNWSRSAGDIDYYYWWTGTEALAHFGGIAWERWRAHLFEAVSERGIDDGPAGLYWPPVDAWSAAHTEVHATALVALTLSAAIESER